MPHLVLARHATAARPPMADFDRPLTAAGSAEAAAAGEHLTRYPLTHLVASAALRTVQTGEAVARALADAPVLHTDRALYEADIDAWLEVIATIPETATGAYIVGHEPTVSAVIGHLCPALGVPQRFRPSSVAVFDLPHWGLAPGDYPMPEIRNFKD